MPIISLNFTKIEAESKPITGKIDKIERKMIPVIEKVEKRDIANLKDVVAIDFSFEIKYEPEIGSNNFKGTVLYKADKPDETIAEWKKNQKFSDKDGEEIMNTIFQFCILKSIQLSNFMSTELRLPLPINLPVIRKEELEKAGKEKKK